MAGDRQLVGAAEPTVSVVLRTYDHARFIAQAIESVLIQRAPFPFELVIGEDCSSDGTRPIVERYAHQRPEIVRAVLPEHNLGHGEILRQTLNEVRGDFIAYLDGDDYWTSPAKLARQVAFLERNPDCASCFHDVSLIYDEAGLPSGSVSPGFGEERFTLDQIVMECFVPAPAMMFRREIAERLPGWVFNSAWIDWLIHIRSAQLGPIGYIPQPLAAYRVHRGGMFSGLDRVSQLEGDLDFYRRLEPEMPDERDLIERCVSFRQAQLAIERLGVPFDACVVLVDPRHELRPYFNGRHARDLPRREGHEVTELQAIREAAPKLPAATRDYGPAGAPLDGAWGCYAVIPRGAMEWLDQHPQLARYLEEQGDVAWRDEWVVVHELKPLEQADGRAHSRGARRVEVTMLPRSEELAGGYLDAPASGALLPAHAIAVVGWVLGHARHVAAIEFVAGGETIWRAPVQVERPDVAEAFPDLAVEAPGFETTLNGQELPAGSVASVWAVFADGGRVPFAELRLDTRGEAQRAVTP
jgi:glycosyltransferase involved in cell wall biosynthesis